MKWLLVLAALSALLIAGCGNPCDDQLSRADQEEFAVLFAAFSEAGDEAGIFGLLINSDIDTGDACFDFLADQTR